MFNNGLFYVILFSTLFCLFIGNRLTEGSRGHFGHRFARKLLRILKGIIPQLNPKVTLAGILGLATSVFLVTQLSLVRIIQAEINNRFAIVVLVILLVIDLGVDMAPFYIFFERAAEVFTYFCPRLRQLDLTFKSRFVAFFAMILTAMGLISAGKFNDRLDHLASKDHTLAWIRKISKEHREYTERRKENQMALRESRYRYDLRRRRA
ncbi:hypothetical protein IKE72_01690 [Candidatus Saccharibacteria bacterium]|nr:hypothetical protein [Candidatus Saccharibacteria bacterium]